MIYSILFRIEIENTVSKLSKLLNSNLIFIFCNNIVDEFVLEGPLSGTKQTDLDQVFPNSEFRVINPQGKVSYIYVDCDDRNESHLTVAKSCIYRNRGIMMSTYQIDTIQYYSVVIFGKEYLFSFLNDLKSQFAFQMLSQKEIPYLDFESDNPYVKMKRIIDELTALQLSVLKKAIKDGYYENPRKTHMEDIAKDLEKSRSTVETLFRTAENKIMDIIIPELYSYLQQLNSE